jgi:hypothetical protein
MPYKQAKYWLKPEVRESRRLYNQRPEVKEQRKKYRDRPEIRERRLERMKWYNQRPEVKERHRQYKRRPEVRERSKQLQRQYARKPEIRRRRVEYNRKYFQRQKSKVIELFGGKCVYCGCDDLTAFEINHKKGGGRKESNSWSRATYYHKILTGERRRDDLELVCRVCNARHYSEVLKGVSGNWEIKWNGAKNVR